MFFNKTNTAILFLLISISACTSSEIGQSKDVAQDKIYQEYSIKFTEGDPAVTVYAQFRFAGRNGTTLVLSNPSQLSFDNETLKVDSGTVSGAFYQAGKPIAGFYGRHHFVFTDINNKKFDNDFLFDTFRLKQLPGAVSKNKPLDIAMESAPLKGDDYVEVSTSGSDSSFSVRLDAKDGNSIITIPQKELQRQKGKELMLEATLYRNLPLQQNTAEGGSLEIRYALKPIRVRFAD